MSNSQLFAKVKQWIVDDVSTSDQTELLELLHSAQDGDAAALEDLQSKFSGAIEFGTAGLRGKMEPGESRMNLATVSRASFGLGNYCLSRVKRPRIAIGFDARHHSREFALRAAAIQTELGCEVYLMPQALPTPVLAYAVRTENFDAGVMVTASHNPAQDNGYKVYLGGRIVQDDGQGSQIVPPFDSEISQAIQSAPAAKDIPLADGGWQSFPFTIAADYSASVTQIARQFLPDQPNLGLKIVTTAMHGVGGAIQVQQLQSLGFVNLFEVAEQKDPDPDFPTIVFPNPEEAGALDMALDLARRSQADLIIANDPDADRCSIATFDPHGGDYRQWTGDEIGLLLGEFFAQQFRGQNVALASSIVSSRALAKIAAAHQIPYVPTLTGFKWISRVPRLIFGYEEAIGYNPDPEFVHDKDGPATGSIIAALASRPAPSSFNVPPRSLSVSTTLAGFLDEIARRYGLFTQSQVSVRLNSLDSINALVEQFRSRPPEKFGSETVTEVIDYANQPPSPALKTNGISFFTQEQSRIFVRPSGTEPKVKFYLETYRAIDPHCSFGALSNFRAAAREQHRQLSAALRALTKT